MTNSEKENSIGYQLSYTENLHRNLLNKKFSTNKLDITPEQFIILDLLTEHSTGISMQKISEKIHRDNSAITRSIDILEKKNLVSRVNAEKDRRKKIILITKQGITLLHNAKDIAKQYAKEVAKGLTEKQLNDLFSILKIIQKNINESNI
ncbi:MarR family transcriptional regulator [Apibacter sp. B3889]|uniref:MarR family winged helix-turn-helix transcriptional regulator n=1 Tax=unclassified Apibacter TaxID=2630820 RepID=UPI00132ABBD2|nr:MULTISPECIES: MarR family transcriptional regulator [unclassified Apibacter]MXO32156.1 MarR family transcriptional regulator [Apibacter sp. B2912]MXO33912.1 MarR family transcriptional regulator [Apibacter sp. B3883]MXO41269.1 MarR family transcriptional regulator [Apibacter sp. B3889]MXP04576.1 MarR family transcriptional regulator [Apibacter sp. B3887]MXP06751.1 MarR family transcriptional regulator [Apibacter sp. B3935]